MDETKLRQLERQYKLRVKTGCETCRIRRVKCDEAKPECNRCTKTGRKCEGYKHVGKNRTLSPAAAASFRNPSFLVVPQQTSPAAMPQNPSRSISPEMNEDRSFHFFRTHTLPRWTEFFDSDLWSQKILQLSHVEPAIKHGILALSTMHERFETTDPSPSTKASDFAFVQYMQAVKHSNDLLTAHSEGRVDVEKVLIACIIFTCYENLAGNYRAANMHLRNGLRILGQHKADPTLSSQRNPAQESIANVLYRFDLQAMTFSDNTAPYDYNVDIPPECPEIPSTYKSNADARNHLVGLLRCMMWVSGVANIIPSASEHPTWLAIYTQLMQAFDSWELAFGDYQKALPQQEQGDAKIYAGNTLLKIYTIMARFIVQAGSGSRTERSWDSFMDAFQTVVDLAESLPILTGPPSPPSSGASPSPRDTQTPSPQPPASRHHPVAMSPAMPSSTTIPSPGPSTIVFMPELFPESPRIPSKSQTSPGADASGPPRPSKRRPASFSPSFELSPIVPLFVVACRCRDPVLRRRAIALLLNCRRREGVWDSWAAGMVAIQIVKLEEGLDEVVAVGWDNWLPLGTKIKESGEIAEGRRVQDVFVSVNMSKRQIGVNYIMCDGETLDRYVRF